MVLVVEGLNRRCATLAALERARGDGVLDRLVARAVRCGASEWVALVTCSRVELISVRPEAPRTGEEGAPLLLSGEPAVEHLLAVAAGLESELLGENAVLGQVRRAWVEACRAQTTGPVLARLFPRVLRAARAVRRRLGFGRDLRNWPEALLAQLRREGRSLGATKVALLGHGSLGNAVARALVSAGAEVVRPEADSELRKSLPRCSLLICASGRGRLLSVADLRAIESFRGPRETLEIWDLAVPRNVEPSAAGLPWVRLRTEESLGDPASRRADARLRSRGREMVAEEASLLLATGFGVQTEPDPAREVCASAESGFGDHARRGSPVRAPIGRRQPGLVSLVGAGPGDPSLLTRAAINRLELADVILHDALLPAAMLAALPLRARLVAVGGRAGRARLAQREIEQRMVLEARAGRRVVRLKGGDPFVFGRGGEEIVALERAGIPWEAIPGITAACGAAAAFGIPLTHRAESHGVRFVAATLAERKTRAGRANNEATGRITNLDQAADETGPHGATARGGSTETLVGYMAGRRLASFARELLEQGHAPATPAALISRATWTDSALTRATLGELASGRIRTDERGPSLVVIGPAAAWARSASPPPRPRVAVAAVLQDLEAISSTLRAHGLDALEIPLARLAPAGAASLRSAIRRLRDFATLRFEDPHAIEPFLSALRDDGRDLRDLAGIRLEAVGTATARAIRARGLRPDAVIGLPVGAGPAGGSSIGIPARSRALLVRGVPADSASEPVGDGVQRLTLCRMIPHWPDLEDLEADWRSRPPRACLVHSGAVAERLLAALGPLLRSVPVLAPPVLLSRLRGRGLRLRAYGGEADLARFAAAASDGTPIPATSGKEAP